LQLPVVAIGGITPDNGRQLIEAGADMLAVIHGIFAQADVRLATQRYAELFED
jgi:thiamine-phosphate pyrophosphorylase